VMGDEFLEVDPNVEAEKARLDTMIADAKTEIEEGWAEFRAKLQNGIIPGVAELEAAHKSHWEKIHAIHAELFGEDRAKEMAEAVAAKMASRESPAA